MAGTGSDIGRIIARYERGYTLTALGMLSDMTTTEVQYRDYSGGPWGTEPSPGPLPQAVSRKYPTARTYCTCGHNGPVHRRQTLATGAYTPSHPLRYRGECQAYAETGRQCRCTWFIEDLEYNPTDAYLPKPPDAKMQALLDQYKDVFE